MQQRWDSHFVFLLNLRQAIWSLCNNSIKPTSGCCILHIRCLLVALAFFFFLYFKGQKNPETLKQGQQSDSDIKL